MLWRKECCHRQDAQRWGEAGRDALPCLPMRMLAMTLLSQALMKFPPKERDPNIYQDWSARMEALLDYADGGPRPDPTRAPTVDGPAAAGDKTRTQRGHLRGERLAKTAPHAPPCTTPPMAN